MPGAPVGTGAGLPRRPFGRFFFAYTGRVHIASPDFSSLKAPDARPIKENASIGGQPFLEPVAQKTCFATD
ncbi:hypothetical protein SAMN03159417_03032 [Ralstonia sp. NFACC01]|nr:hypothetical protein SAMN03159417_03032 [Ralstonia sp. NFACC01]